MIAQNTENDPKILKFEAPCTETCKLSLEALHALHDFIKAMSSIRITMECFQYVIQRIASWCQIDSCLSALSVGSNCQCIVHYGGWLGPLSAILQFQLPLYFHPISTLFPLWTLTSTLFPLYFHSTSILFPLHFHPSTILLRIGGGGCRVPHHWLVGRVCGPLTLKPVVGPRIFLEHQKCGLLWLSWLARPQ